MVVSRKNIGQISTTDQRVPSGLSVYKNLRKESTTRKEKHLQSINQNLQAQEEEDQRSFFEKCEELNSKRGRQLISCNPRNLSL